MSEQPFYVLITGGRNFTDRKMAFESLAWIKKHCLPEGRRMVIVHGGASGADGLAQKFAGYRKIPCFCVPAEWDRFGPSAGPRRNGQMLDWLPIELVVAFPGGGGTSDMCKQACRKGVPVYRFEQFEETPPPGWQDIKINGATWRVQQDHGL